MRKLSKLLLGSIILFVLIIQVYPIFWIFTSSFKTLNEFRINNPYSMPEFIYIDNYIKAFRIANLPAYFKNSFIITLFSIVGIGFFGAMGAFAIQKMKFKINRFMLTFFLSGIMIPIQITLIPLFIIYKNLNMLNTYFSLILPQIGFGLPMSIYLFTAFYKYIPNEIFESAVIDGSNIYRLFFSLVIPMSKNTIITILTMNTISIWNEFVLANTFISKAILKTVPIGLYDYQGDFGMTDWGATFSAIAVTTIPVLILFFILNKGVISGMTAGAVKS